MAETDIDPPITCTYQCNVAHNWNILELSVLAQLNSLLKVQLQPAQNMFTVDARKA